MAACSGEFKVTALQLLLLQELSNPIKKEPLLLLLLPEEGARRNWGMQSRKEKRRK